ncbi:MAG TPA: UDP-2,3-diacylglucosamine diphosphatase LpxI [Rhizobiales bacterium]|nr:UDP-2,3-diacylglucosamine diphosphatase LpxI [Hyphomicrobiales bacterium]
MTSRTRGSEPRRAAVALSAGDRIAIIAGSGALPVALAKGLERRGHRPFVIQTRGEVDDPAAFAAFDGISLELEEIGRLVPTLTRNRITHAVLAGGIGRRPNWKKLRPSIGLLRILPVVISRLARGDNAVLSALVDHIEANGIRVVGAHQILPNLLAAPGSLGAHAPSDRDRRDITAAWEAALAIGALDIGQAAVAIGGRVIALEGIEGTDGLLERVRDLRTHGRIGGAGGGVLVKCAKPRQELRADLPTIGPLTVEAAHAAGLAGIAIEADRSLILEATEVAARADRAGLFVVGLQRPEQ